MKSFLKIGSMVLVFLMCISFFAGCRKSGTSSDNSATNQATDNNGTKNENSKMKVKYMISRSMDDPLAKTAKSIFDDYKKENPDFSYEFESIADRPAYLQKIKTLVASSEMPDWFEVDADAYTRQLAEKGLLTDMGKAFDEMGLTDKFQAAALNYQKFDDGSLYLMPMAYNIEMFWYNKSLFEQAGIAETPKTFDEFMADCETLKQKGITPITVCGRDKWPLIRYIAYLPFRNAGNDYIEKLKKGEASLADPIGQEACNFVRDLGTKGYFEKGFANVDYSASRDLFLGGKAAMWYIGTWELSSFLDENLPDDMKGKVDYFSLPMTANAKTKQNDIWAHSGIGTAVNSAKYNDSMKNLIKFYYDKYANVAMDVGGFFPPVKVDLKPDAPELYKKVSNDMNNVGDFAYCWDVRFDPVTNELFGNEIISLAMGAEKPEEFAKKIDASLKENGPKFFK